MDVYELIVKTQYLLEKHGITGKVRPEEAGSNKVTIRFEGLFLSGPAATERFFHFGFDLRELEPDLSRFNLNYFPSDISLATR